jgi:hypothetical protein
VTGVGAQAQPAAGELALRDRAQLFAGHGVAEACGMAVDTDVSGGSADISGGSIVATQSAIRSRVHLWSLFR